MRLAFISVLLVFLLTGCSSMSGQGAGAGVIAGAVMARAVQGPMLPLVIVGAVIGTSIGAKLEQERDAKREELARLKVEKAKSQAAKKMQREKIIALQREINDLESRIAKEKQRIN